MVWYIEARRIYAEFFMACQLGGGLVSVLFGFDLRFQRQQAVSDGPCCKQGKAIIEPRQILMNSHLHFCVDFKVQFLCYRASSVR